MKHLSLDKRISKFTIFFCALFVTFSVSRAFVTSPFVGNKVFANDEVKSDVQRHMFFDFHDDPIIIPQEKYISLLYWAFDGKDQSLAIQKSKLGHGFGLYTTKAIDSGTTVFTISHDKCLSLDAAKAHPTLGESLTTMDEDLGPEFGPVAVLSSFLASELLREQCAEWEEDDSLSGPYKEYLSILPSGRGVSEQDHVLWWSQKEVDDLFSGGAAHDKATVLREWVEAEGSVIEGMLVSDLAQKQMGLSISQVRGSITTSFVNVFSRSLFVGGIGAQRLVPVLDMCQHSNTPNLKHVLDDDGNVIVKASRHISAGEELTIHYYSTEFEGHEFYVMYGFVVPFANEIKVQA